MILTQHVEQVHCLGGSCFVRAEWDIELEWKPLDIELFIRLIAAGLL